MSVPPAAFAAYATRDAKWAQLLAILNDECSNQELLLLLPHNAPKHVEWSTRVQAALVSCSPCSVMWSDFLARSLLRPFILVCVTVIAVSLSLLRSQSQPLRWRTHSIARPFALPRCAHHPHNTLSLPLLLPRLFRPRPLLLWLISLPRPSTPPLHRPWITCQRPEFPRFLLLLRAPLWIPLL